MDQRVLLVYRPGGTPLEYAVPRIAKRAEVHILALSELPVRTRPMWLPFCASVTPALDAPEFGDGLAELIAAQAHQIGADAIFTLAEFAMLVVADAADRLGLRGAGPNAALTRDKRLMRAAWARAGVPSPRFRLVSCARDLELACRELTLPLLLKSAWGAGSMGHVVVSSPDEASVVWPAAQAAMADAKAAGYRELRHRSTDADFLAEEIIAGSPRSWWPAGSGYGDYLSVEGVVADGVYHPVCITSRLPTIPPFTEVSNLAPCALPEGLQRQIESVARAAVDALGLQTCGTHTEIKLMDGNQLCLIESAGRLAGVMVPAEVEHVFGYDLVGMVVDSLLGRPADFPDRMLTDQDAVGAAASIPMIATNASGVPWARELVWDSSVPDWPALLAPGSRIETVPGLSIPDGTRIPAYQPAGGVLAWGGQFFLRSRDAGTLVQDAYAVLNGLEGALARGWHARAEQSVATP